MHCQHANVAKELCVDADRLSLVHIDSHSVAIYTDYRAKQESLADAKVSARQQCVYEGP